LSLPDALPICIATNRKWTDRASGQPREETAWFRVSVWGRRGEVAHQYLSKGSAVLVEGRLQVDAQSGGPRLFTRQDGTVGASFEITADNIAFLGSRGDSGGSSYSEGGYEGGKAAEEEDDIPF